MSDIMDLVGLDEEEKLFIKQQIEEKGLDPARYVKKLIQRGIREEKVEKAIEKYLGRETSISGAAELAGVSIYAFLEELKAKGYVSDYDIDDFHRGVRALKED